MTIEIHGRTRHADTATSTITIRQYNQVIAVIHGGLIEPKGHDGNTFILGAKHLTAVDDEGDPAYVAYFEGAGLRFQTMNPNGFNASAVLLSAKYDLDADPKAERLRFTPPKQKWEAGVYDLWVDFAPVAPASSDD